MFKKPPAKPHVSPKVRAYGRARVEIAQRISSPQDWEKLWKPAQNPFPFTWGKYWKQCIEYRVDDFVSEVGFFVDILGLPVIAFDPTYAMFTSPNGDFTFAVAQSADEKSSTPPEAIRIQFMVDRIFETTEELERRGILFSRKPEPITEGSSMLVASFQTPHGIYLDLWGEEASEGSKAPENLTEVVEEDDVEEIDVEEDDVEEVEAEEDAFEEELAEPLHQPESSKTNHEKEETDDLDVDDLFEEIHDEPKAKPVFDNMTKPKPKRVGKQNKEEEINDEVQYVDEPDADETYPTYKPLPFGK